MTGLRSDNNSEYEKLMETPLLSWLAPQLFRRTLLQPHHRRGLGCLMDCKRERNTGQRFQKFTSYNGGCGSFEVNEVNKAFFYVRIVWC